MLFEQKITLLEFESEFIKFLHLIKNNSFTLKKEKRKKTFFGIHKIWRMIISQP